MQEINLANGFHKKKAIQFPKFILCPEVFKCHRVLPSGFLLFSRALGWENISAQLGGVLTLPFHFMGVERSHCWAFQFVDCGGRAFGDTVSHRAVNVSEAILPSPWSSF